MQRQKDEIDGAILWLKEQISTCAFGEVGIKAITHDGHVVRVERTVVTKQAASLKPAGDKK